MMPVAGLSMHADLLNIEVESQCCDENQHWLRGGLAKRAAGALKIGDLNSAHLLYTKALQLKPDDVLYTNRSIVQLNSNNLDEALIDVGMALDLEPTSVKAHYQKALILRRKGEFEKALQVCTSEHVKGDNEILKLADDIILDQTRLLKELKDREAANTVYEMNYQQQMQQQAAQQQNNSRSRSRSRSRRQSRSRRRN